MSAQDMSAQEKAPSTASPPATWAIGVDGGGTKTEAWLAHGPRSAPQLLGRGSAGPGNPQAAGVAGASENILAAIRAAFADAELRTQSVGTACLALAGVGRETLRAQMQHWAQSAGLAQQIQVVHDAQAVLAGGTPHGCGIALICGTGSLAFGLTATGSSGAAADGAICGVTKAADTASAPRLSTPLPGLGTAAALIHN